MHNDNTASPDTVTAPTRRFRSVKHIYSTVVLVAAAFFFLVMTPNAQAQCTYSCSQVEGMIMEQGALPAGVSITFLPGNSTPGGTNTFPCDNCLACKQRVSVVVQDSAGTVIWGWKITPANNPDDASMGSGTGGFTWNPALDPFCGDSQTIEIVLDAPPVVLGGDYSLSYTFSCNC